MNSSEAWYVVKGADGHCEIVSHPPSGNPSVSSSTDATDDPQRWGPFASQGEAIARRVGLIRSGKCQPL